MNDRISHAALSDAALDTIFRKARSFDAFDNLHNRWTILYRAGLSDIGQSP